ncbi:nudC domain-containing protein 1 isoform X1 [Sturnira hondurensis]|uniref:nudC domain-containing protein 1 isoform X1 n=1 Tax=Sturnira hondurensis TaxID=192404 RepID=UPI00187922FA|nr:nudC domain-containing protein 1 isoform X1 [Sturnira hondurensis]
MEVAANCSLRVKRPLLDPRFEGYKLSLEPLPCYQLELDAAVAEVKLRDDQYTLEHMHAFGMYNYLHCDSWYQDSVYYVDNLGRIMNLTVMLDTALGKPREVFRLPTDVTAYDNRLCASVHFTSSTWVTLSDGTGRLYLIETGERGNSASEKWEIMFNEELGNPFIIIHSISLLKAEEHSIATLLLRVEKEELDLKGSGFIVSLEWVTISKKNKDDKKYEIIKRNILRGKSVPNYAAIEPDGSGLMIVSYKSFTSIPVGHDVEESKDEDMSEKTKVEPLYYWQQTEDDVTATVRLPEDSAKEDVQVQFLPDHVTVVLKGQKLLEGGLFSSIDHESSTWIIKENNSLEISFIKKNEGLTWLELVVGDKQGEYIRDSAQCAAIAERLMHLTSEELNPNPDKEKPPCNAQELEECDIFFEESSSLCRFDSNTLKTTHVVNLGSNQYLFSVVVDPKEMPGFCLRHDVDALLWQPHTSRQDMWEHIATFNALGYVQASKRDKKFFTCAPDYSYAALCECLRRVFIYRQPTPMPTVLYNRKEGRQVGQVAKQQVASLETNDPILGFQATNERLFVLTTRNLFLIKVKTEH